MNIVKRRWTLIIWNLVLVVLGAGSIALSGYLIATNNPITDKNKFNNWYLTIILLVGCWAAFASLYCVPFIFKRNKYPYVTCEKDEFSYKFLNWLSQYKWLWLYIFPILTAWLFPIIVLIILQTMDPIFRANINNGTYAIILISVSTLFSINNIIFVYIMKKIRQQAIISPSNEFIFHNE